MLIRVILIALDFYSNLEHYFQFLWQGENTEHSNGWNCDCETKLVKVVLQSTSDFIHEYDC